MYINVGRHSATTKFSPEATISPIPSGFKNQSLDFKELSNVAIPFDERFHGAFSLNLGGNLPVKSHYQKKFKGSSPKYEDTPEMFVKKNCQIGNLLRGWKKPKR